MSFLEQAESGRAQLAGGRHELEPLSANRLRQRIVRGDRDEREARATAPPSRDRRRTPATVSRGNAADGCSAISSFGPSASARARCTRIWMSGAGLPGRHVEQRRRRCRHRAPARRPAGTTRGSIGSTSSVNDIAMFCSTENASIRMPRAVIMPTPIERLQPGVAVGDGAGVLAEHDDVALVRQRRAGDEVHEGLGGGRVEAGDRDDRRPAHGQLADAQRPQRLVVLDQRRGSRAAASAQACPRRRLSLRARPDRRPAASPAPRDGATRARACCRAVALAQVACVVAVKVRSAADEHAERRRPGPCSRCTSRASDRSDRPRSRRGRARRAARSARRAWSRPGCANDATPPAAWMISTTSAGSGRCAARSRPAGGEPPVERVLHRRHMTGPHQRARELRAADRRSRARRGREQTRLDVDRHAERRQRGADLAHALHAQRALPLEERRRAARSPDRRSSRARARRGRRRPR